MSCQLRIQDFPEEGGGANSQTGYANIFFSRKLHENGRICTGGVPGAPLDPPLIAVCILDSGDLCKGLTSVSQQCIGMQLRHLLLETMYNLQSN